MNKFDSFVKDNRSLVKRKKGSLADNLDTMMFRYTKQFSMGTVELINNIVFHGLDTLKVRLQAKCHVEDVANFYKNKVQNKPLISGVTSAGLGSFFAGFCFVYASENFLHYFFRKNKKTFLDDFDWKAKLLVSYILADLVKTTVFLPFEARKQRIQLYQKLGDISMTDMSKYMIRGFFPIILRDCLFRIITLGSFLKSLNVEHKPNLKYKLDEIREVIKAKEKKGEKLNVSYFMDYSKFNIYSPFHIILTNLVVCTIVATVLTHPLDVVLTKILTQTRLKYKGTISGIRTVAQEEGYKKLFFSGLSARISFNIFSAMSVFILYESFINVISKYYENEDE